MLAIHRPVTESVHNGQLVFYNKALQHDNVVLLIGDSVIERLLWFARKQFPPNVVVMAKGGDKTGHLLWRIDNTPDEGSDKVSRIILHIGTNNLGARSRARSVFDAIQNVVRVLHQKYKCAHIYVIPLYCRGDVDPELIYHVNQDLLKIKDAEILGSFWDGIVEEGVYDPSRFEDMVHLNKSAYDDFYRKILTYINN